MTMERLISGMAPRVEAGQCATQAYLMRSAIPNETSENYVIILRRLDWWLVQLEAGLGRGELGVPVQGLRLRRYRSSRHMRVTTPDPSWSGVRLFLSGR